MNRAIQSAAAADRSIILDAVGATAGYPGRFEVGPVTAALCAGEVWGVVGPNGSGKTTLLRALGGLQPCLEGRVFLEGRDLRALSARERARRLAWLPQSVEAPVPFTVREMVSLGRTPHISGWLPLSAQDVRAIEEAMTRMNLRELQDRALPELSAGERRRAAVAMAVAQEPRVLILDEPTAHLDVHHADQLMQAVRRLARAQNLTVAASLHDLNLAAAYCDRLILLRRGSVAAIGSRKDVLQQQVLETVYGMPLDVTRHADDRWSVIPRYALGETESSDGAASGAAG